MRVTRVHLLNDEKGTCVWVDTTWGSIDNAMPISEAMAKCLTVDVHNQVVEGRGHVSPTPWGWYWLNSGKAGRLPVPPKLYYGHYPYCHPNPIALAEAIIASERR